MSEVAEKEHRYKRMGHRAITLPLYAREREREKRERESWIFYRVKQPEIDFCGLDLPLMVQLVRDLSHGLKAYPCACK